MNENNTVETPPQKKESLLKLLFLYMFPVTVLMPELFVVLIGGSLKEILLGLPIFTLVLFLPVSFLVYLGSLPKKEKPYIPYEYPWE